MKDSPKSVVFLVGSGINAPVRPGAPGVPLASGIIDLVREQFPTVTQAEFDSEISSASNRYQAAFSFLIGHRGQDAANALIRRAVARARKQLPGMPNQEEAFGEADSEDACAGFEADYDGWDVNPGARALAALATG